MDTGYRIDDVAPLRGTVVHAFRTLEDCQAFVKLQGGLFGGMRIWEVEGRIVADDGGPDGLQIRVQSYRQV